MEEVKLHGTWYSPYSWRVMWALRLKGIPYEFIEEDLSNKSDLLLELNPVHKKIPVLLHGGKSICESTVIMEYIEETWPCKPLLPCDSYERAVARFWLNFADVKLSIMWKMSKVGGDELQQVIKESLEILQTLEEHALREKKYFGGDKIDMVDLSFGGIAHVLEAIEYKIGTKLVEGHKFPRLLAWIHNFKSVPILSENLPNLKPPFKNPTPN
ncbi:hypothetical protein K2173_003655 [Erythroxylum novogranatense]|uniref:Glutathione S-transferase n=1 Tax=Erythroxylum novogranatense TaxID=1862640 RepID=A0AAV8TAX7_9ROSI|nr:hypothetical protein K2173_003655 [Erythroxylum novogranatense]